MVARPAPRHPTAGFTLVELVVVIALLGILAAVALPRFTNLRDSAEQAAITGWIGGLRTAYGTMFASAIVGNAGYTSPWNVSLYNITRCDNVDAMDPRTPAWQGHHIALASLRDSVFADRTQSACSNNTISFTSKSGRAISITNTGSGITWTATPAY